MTGRNLVVTDSCDARSQAFFCRQAGIASGRVVPSHDQSAEVLFPLLLRAAAGDAVVLVWRWRAWLCCALQLLRIRALLTLCVFASCSLYPFSIRFLRNMLRRSRRLGHSCGCRKAFPPHWVTFEHRYRGGAALRCDTHGEGMAAWCCQGSMQR